jgi:uncharacterized protein YbjT (DUF2867 family)
MILVTGATGNVGTELARILTARDVPFRAMVRSPEAAKKTDALVGAEIVVGDFDDAAAIARALAGVERAFLLTNSSQRAEERQAAFVAAARRAGVRHVVKLSQWAADPGSPVRFLRYHAAVENAIRESGMGYTFLRPNLFMQGLLGFRASIVAEGQFYAAAGDAKISAVDVRDIAAVAAAALTEDEHAGRTYDITGPEALTHTEMAERLSAAVGRRIEFVDVAPDAMRQALVSAGVQAWQADGLLEDYAHYRRGEAAAIASGIQEASGKAPRTFADFASDYAAVFA